MNLIRFEKVKILFNKIGQRFRLIATLCTK